MERTVEAHMLASAVGSGSLDVLATPWLVALMEAAACTALDGVLDDGQTSVGVRIDVQHLAPTPLGGSVSARAEVTQGDGTARGLQSGGIRRRRESGPGDA